jgi:hypothetical protein
MNSIQTAELDAKNRAAVYLRDAQKQADEAQDAAAKQHSTEFQQLLWMKNLDHQHALEMRDAERRAAIELKTLELERVQPLAAGNSQPHTEPFWQSRWFLTLLTVAVPVALPFLFRFARRSRRQVKRNFYRQWRRKNRRPTRIIYAGRHRRHPWRARRWI